MEWKRIKDGDAPEGEPHVRGLWVYNTNIRTGERWPAHFDAHAGYVDDTGEWVATNGYDDMGWSADDYEWWAPLPLPLPPTPEQNSDGT